MLLQNRALDAELLSLTLRVMHVIILPQDQAVRSAITSSAMCVWLLGILVGVLCFVPMFVGVLHVLLAGLGVVVRTVILIAAAPLAMHSRLMIMHDTVVVLVDDIKWKCQSTW